MSEAFVFIIALAAFLLAAGAHQRLDDIDKKREPRAAPPKENP